MGDGAVKSKCDSVAAALGHIPSGLYVLTASLEDRRMGMLASWVQQAGFQPPMVSVAVSKGRSIMPLISSSRRFGLCQLGEDEKVILRKFGGKTNLREDPFLGFEMVSPTALGVPILANAVAYLECEVAYHVHGPGDHDLFIGAVRSAGFNGGRPQVRLRQDGFKY